MSEREKCSGCGAELTEVRCLDCEGGFDGHDCGEDCCACRYPEPNVPCDMCHGTGLVVACEFCYAAARR